MKCILKFNLLFFLGLFALVTSVHSKKIQSQGEIRKLKDIIIYEDSNFYSAFPSVVKNQNGEIIVAFRRAPDRAIFLENNNLHIDPNSYLMKVVSTDGEHWTKEPELIYAHPYGGSQDPCMLQLKDGTIICSSYLWIPVRPSGFERLKKPISQAHHEFVFHGGYIIRSFDGGKTWGKPIYPPHVESQIKYNALGDLIPAYNRGALYEDDNGRILWAAVANSTESRTSVHLMVSDDKGETWSYMSPIADDENIIFNETSIYQTPKGDIVAFLRTDNYEDNACIARSTDGGKTFNWKAMGFKGHPLNALRLPDNRVLLTYGYRHEPYGIRARILNEECTDFSSSKEFVLREDGGGFDIGYTWPVLLEDNKVLIVYYYHNKDNITRYIAGTIIEID